MKVVLKVGASSFGDTPRHQLVIDGKDDRHIGSLSECPEDAIIGRDLVDGDDIIRYIQMGYGAAKRGETLEVSREEMSDDD